MKLSKIIGIVAGIALVAWLATHLPIRPDSKSSNAPTEISERQSAASASPAPAETRRSLQHGASIEPASLQANSAPAQSHLIRLRNGEALARVNDKAIQLGDLVPVT